MAWSSTSSSTTSQSYSYWGSMKALGAIVESTVVRKTPGIRHDLEAALRKHKPQFIALLKNPVRPGDHFVAWASPTSTHSDECNLGGAGPLSPK